MSVLYCNFTNKKQMETALLCMIAAAVVAVFILIGKLNAARRELSRVKYEAEDGL